MGNQQGIDWLVALSGGSRALGGPLRTLLVKRLYVPFGRKSGQAAWCGSRLWPLLAV